MSLPQSTKFPSLAAVLIATTIATPVYAGDANCAGVVIDHGHDDVLQLLNPDGSPAETMSGAKPDHSLVNQLSVYNCNPTYFAVMYHGQKRLVARGDVSTTQKNYDVQPCSNTSNKDKTAYGAMGSSGKMCKDTSGG